MGNRGRLHDSAQRLGTARWRHQNWICCLTSFKGRKRELMAPNSYTELFFLDEAVALSAGHRPCAECRRADYLRFRDAWTTATGQRPSAAEMDKSLHQQRVTRNRSQVRYTAILRELPDGTYILHAGQAHLWQAGRLFPFFTRGYGAAIEPSPSAGVIVLTPLPTVRVLAAGYEPQLHQSAQVHG